MFHFIKLFVFFRNSSILKHKSNNSLSDDSDDYLDTCPIYHDIDSQSIYGVEVIQHHLKKSEEFLWKDCKLFFIVHEEQFETNLNSFLVDYKFEPPSTHRTSPDTGIELLASSEFHKINKYDDDSDDTSSAKSLRWFESPSEHSIHLASSWQIYQEKKIKPQEHAKRHSIFTAMRRASMHFLPQKRRNTSVG